MQRRHEYVYGSGRPTDGSGQAEGRAPASLPTPAPLPVHLRRWLRRTYPLLRRRGDGTRAWRRSRSSCSRLRCRTLMQARTDGPNPPRTRPGPAPWRRIAHLLSDNTVVIFSLSKGCSACRRVKSYFEDEGIPYYALELDQRSDGDALKAALAERTGSSKTPTVYIRGHLVGGTSDVSRAYKSGELSHWTDDPDAVAPPEDETCDAPLVSHEV